MIIANGATARHDAPLGDAVDSPASIAFDTMDSIRPSMDDAPRTNARGARATTTTTTKTRRPRDATLAGRDDAVAASRATRYGTVHI